MRKPLLLTGLLLFAVALSGCGEGDAGDVEKANAASAAMPKSAADLPSDMPPEAKRAAESAMKQNEAQKQSMDAQAEAMRRARQQGSGR